MTPPYHFCIAFLVLRGYDVIKRTITKYWVFSGIIGALINKHRIRKQNNPLPLSAVQTNMESNASTHDKKRSINHVKGLSINILYYKEDMFVLKALKLLNRFKKTFHCFFILFLIRVRAEVPPYLKIFKRGFVS